MAGAGEQHSRSEVARTYLKRGIIDHVALEDMDVLQVRNGGSEMGGPRSIAHNGKHRRVLSGCLRKNSQCCAEKPSSKRKPAATHELADILEANASGSYKNSVGSHDRDCG